MSNIVHSISKSDGFASVHSPSVRLAPRAGMDNLGQTPHTIHFDRSKLGKIVTPLQESVVGGMDVAGYSCPWNVPVGTFLGLMSSARLTAYFKASFTRFSFRASCDVFAIQKRAPGSV